MCFLKMCLRINIFRGKQEAFFYISPVSLRVPAADPQKNPTPLLFFLKIILRIELCLIFFKFQAKIRSLIVICVRENFDKKVVEVLQMKFLE